MTRMFVAVIPPDHVLDDLEAFITPRRGEVPFRWTDPEQWHLTLAFSRDVPDRSYDDLVDRLTRAAAKRHPVEARVAGGGAFPNVGRAKIVYAGLDTDLVYESQDPFDDHPRLQARNDFDDYLTDEAFQARHPALACCHESDCPEGFQRCARPRNAQGYVAQEGRRAAAHHVPARAAI